MPARRSPNTRPSRDELSDDAVLTQFGNRLNPGFCIFPFRSQLRIGEKGLSLTIGERSVKEMVDLMYRGRRSASMHDGVRYTTAGKLRAAGFLIVPDGGKRNPDHVSVCLDGDTDWTDDESARFSECFGQPVWMEDGDA